VSTQDTDVAGLPERHTPAPGPDTSEAGPRIEEEDLARLPGPRRHLGLLEADLRAGQSCVWYFPDPVVESGRADFFLRELMHRLDAVIPVPGVMSLADRDTAAARVPSQRVPPAEPDGPRTDPDDRWDDGPADDPYGSLLGRLAAPGGTVAPPVAVTAPVPSETATLEERLAKELGVPGAPLEALAEGAAAGHAPQVIVVRCWEESSSEEAARLLRVAQATFHDAGLPASARPRFLIASRAGDLPRAAIGGHGRITVHWWWKVWTRLDTEVLMAWRSRTGAADAAHALLHRVTDAVVTEVCGPDIDRALALRRTWDGGDLGTLRQALARLLPERGTAGEEAVPHRRISTAHASVPDAGIHDAWARGAVDSWDGSIRPTRGHALVDPDSHALRVLVCHAQNRVLLPLIEDARTALIRLVPGLLRTHYTVRDFCERARSQHRDDAEDTGVPDLRELEIGGLSHASYMLSLTTAQRHRLRVLRTARNTLSHRAPLAHDDLLALTKVLTTDWTVD
jgi:hypothetical protein